MISIEAKQIVNKWLCRALDKNDGKAAREACIVLKAMDKDGEYDEYGLYTVNEDGEVIDYEDGVQEKPSYFKTNESEVQQDLQLLKRFFIKKDKEDICKDIIKSLGVVATFKNIGETSEEGISVVQVNLPSSITDKQEAQIYQLCAPYMVSISDSDELSKDLEFSKRVY